MTSHEPVVDERQGTVFGRSTPAPDAVVVLVVPLFPSGSETFVFNKAIGLADRGWRVTVACNRSDPRSWDDYPVDQVSRMRSQVSVGAPHRPLVAALLHGPSVVLRSVRAAPGPTLRYLRRGWRRFGPGVLKRFYLDCHIVALQPDVLHFEFGSLAAERMYLKDLIGCRITVSFRGYDLATVGLDQPDFLDDVWGKADAFHFLGDALVELARRRGAPATLTPTLIPPAVDTDRFAPPDRDTTTIGVADRPLRLLTVGRLHWKKGHEYGLDAVRILVERGIAVDHRIVGDGDQWEAVHFWRHQNGLDAVVEVLGALPHEAIVEQMAWADLLLHPAVTEAFGNAVIEAQAMALPVVCSDAGGLPENVEDEVTGLVVPRRDAAALADAMEALAGDGERRVSMGRSGRERVLERFRLDRQLDAIEAFYRRVLDP